MFWGRLKLGALYSHLLYYLVILFACQFIYNYLPRETKDPDSPISVKAIHELLKNLTDIGPRVVGSEENEIQTVEFLLSTLESTDRKSLYPLEISHQVVSGHLTLPNRHINYRDLQNVVAKLVLSGNPRGPSILFNCHFDTVPLSPGASDDGISCAIMLHLIDIFATKVASSRYHYNLIFLFNGAEESYLPASHGFVKRHPWAQNISMFINLEAAGAGGREMLFQSGPGKPWILETYLKSAPRPGANVFAQELFESGAIPSDTDFRIFRDFGNLSGLDIAFVKNGYVYHTKYDSLKRVSYGSTLRCAENLLAITEALLTIEKNAMETNSSSETSTPVFFDFLGLYAVSYSAETAMLLNIVVAITALVPLCFKFFHMSSFFGRMSPLVAYTCLIYLYRVMGLMISLGVAIGTYKILRLFNATMSWYSSFAKAIPLYGVPYISSMVCVLTCVFWEKNYPPNLTIGLLQLVTQMEFIVMLVAGTLLQIKTTYVIMLFVMFPMIGELIDSLLRKTTRRRYHKWISGWK